MQILRCALMVGCLSMMAGLASADEGVFKVCADPNNPPLSLENGKGYENKIARLFADTLGQKLEYTWFPQRLGFIRNTLKAKIPDTETYKCDVVMGVPDGFEIAATTRPYYRSTYVLVLLKGGALDAVKAPNDLDRLPEEVRSKLRIAMFDGAPGTTWLLNHGLITRGIPYQTMTGDTSENTAQVLLRDFTEKKLDMVIIWGPMAAYLAKEKPGMFELIPMASEPGLRFDFAMSMGVRMPDKERKKLLDDLIEKKASEIEAILKDYGVPLLPIGTVASKPH